MAFECTTSRCFLSPNMPELKTTDEPDSQWAHSDESAPQINEWLEIKGQVRIRNQALTSDSQAKWQQFVFWLRTDKIVGSCLESEIVGSFVWPEIVGSFVWPEIVGSSSRSKPGTQGDRRISFEIFGYPGIFLFLCFKIFGSWGGQNPTLRSRDFI